MPIPFKTRDKDYKCTLVNFGSLLGPPESNYQEGN